MTYNPYIVIQYNYSYLIKYQARGGMWGYAKPLIRWSSRSEGIFSFSFFFFQIWLFYGVVLLQLLLKCKCYRSVNLFNHPLPLTHLVQIQVSKRDKSDACLHVASGYGLLTFINYWKGRTNALFKKWPQSDRCENENIWNICMKQLCSCNVIKT